MITVPLCDLATLGVSGTSKCNATVGWSGLRLTCSTFLLFSTYLAQIERISHAHGLIDELELRSPLNKKAGREGMEIVCNQ